MIRKYGDKRQGKVLADDKKTGGQIAEGKRGWTQEDLDALKEEQADVLEEKDDV